jgi:hypothetical protein
MHRGLIDPLRAQERFLQVNGAGVSLELVLGLGAEVHPAMPCPISAIAEQQQAAGVQADHSPSP